MFRGKGWFSGGLWKPKNPHSLEHLKYLYHILSKNQLVTEQNKGLLVETLRSIAEILIWGDQNDSTVFDFFLEKNMLSFFLKIMKQKCGRYVCVQLLQTLNILFENIRNETSLYYLLSNNHVNSIIVHKFDFSDEEVMAYYISFLKTLSLKLNTHTIHFFYNEHTNDFPLYTEAIKFFNHSESMVRIAVRTLTLNVFKVPISQLKKKLKNDTLMSTVKARTSCSSIMKKVDDKAMLKFIRDKTAAPYFSNLVWFIGNNVLELNSCVKTDSDLQIRTRLSDLVAEHLDHLHYLNDILCLQIDALNDVLTNHLLNRLLIPLYVYSLTQRRHLSMIEEDKPHVCSVVSLFLLSQVFLILSHQPLVQQLAYIILNGEMSVLIGGPRTDSLSSRGETGSEPEFVAPEETLEKSLEAKIRSQVSPNLSRDESGDISVSSVEEVIVPPDPEVIEETVTGHVPELHEVNSVHEGMDESIVTTEPTEKEPTTTGVLSALEGPNITDEEKVVAAQKVSSFDHVQQSFTLSDRPFLEAVFSALDCTENDHAALFALCLLYALGYNPGINQDLLDTVLMPSDKSETKLWYNVNLIERMIKIISLSCQYSSKVRLATLQMSILLLKQLVVKDEQSFLQDRHLAAIEQYREESALMLCNFYKSEEIFLDMFEDEYEEMKKKPLNVEYLMMDANLLLPPTGTPMSGVEFHKRLPCGEVERARRAIRVFFLLRDLSLTLQNEPETQLPLTNISSCIKVNDVLDLNNSDLIGCTVVTKDGQKIRRFMVIDTLQLVLVEPDTKRLGWGVAKFVGFLQDIEVTGDKDDSRCLHITVHHPSSIAAGSNRCPLLAARFVFDDHIRCMAAKQRLTKGRLKARQRKLHQIARLLDLPDHIQPCPSPLRHGLHAAREGDRPASMHRSQSQDTGLRGRTVSPSSNKQAQYVHRPIFSSSSNKVPGYVTMLKHDETRHPQTGTEVTSKNSSIPERRRTSSSPVVARRQSPRSRESSPRQRTNSSSEEIPLEDLSRTRGSRHSSPNIRRRSSSGLPQARISAPPGMCHIHHLSPGSHGRVTATTTNLSEVAAGCERDILNRNPSINSDEFFLDDEEGPSPKTLRPADALPLSLVVSSENEKSSLANTPLLLPPTDHHASSSIADMPESPPDMICTKPCCAMEMSHEKLDLGPSSSRSHSHQESNKSCLMKERRKHTKDSCSRNMPEGHDIHKLDEPGNIIDSSAGNKQAHKGHDFSELQSGVASASTNKVKGAIQTV